MKSTLLVIVLFISLSSLGQISAQILALDLILEPTSTTQENDDPMAGFMAAGEMDCTLDLSVDLLLGIDSVTVYFGSSTGASDYGSYTISATDFTLAENHTPDFSAIAMRNHIGIVNFQTPFHSRAILHHSDGSDSDAFDSVIE